MNFGFSPGDVIALVNLAWTAYKGWKRACGEYSDITTLLDVLLVNLECIGEEVEKPNSVLARTAKDRNTLEGIVSSCVPTVRELNNVLANYGSLGSNRRKNWDKLRFGVKNLSDLRTKLNGHIAAITLHLNTIGLGSFTRIENDLHALPGRIQISIDHLAEEIRAGRREGSILTTYGDDEKEVWKQFRRELISEGMDSGFISRYKPSIIRYLQDLSDRGELHERSIEASEVNTAIAIVQAKEVSSGAADGVQRTGSDRRVDRARTKTRLSFQPQYAATGFSGVILTGLSEKDRALKVTNGYPMDDNEIVEPESRSSSPSSSRSSSHSRSRSRGGRSRRRSFQTSYPATVESLGGPALRMLATLRMLAKLHEKGKARKEAKRDKMIEDEKVRPRRRSRSMKRTGSRNGVLPGDVGATELARMYQENRRKGNIRDAINKEDLDRGRSRGRSQRRSGPLSPVETGFGGAALTGLYEKTYELQQTRRHNGTEDEASRSRSHERGNTFLAPHPSRRRGGSADSSPDRESAYLSRIPYRRRGGSGDRSPVSDVESRPYSNTRGRCASSFSEKTAIANDGGERSSTTHRNQYGIGQQTLDHDQDLGETEIHVLSDDGPRWNYLPGVDDEDFDKQLEEIESSAGIFDHTDQRQYPEGYYFPPPPTMDISALSDSTSPPLHPVYNPLDWLHLNPQMTHVAFSSLDHPIYNPLDWVGDLRTERDAYITMHRISSSDETKLDSRYEGEVDEGDETGNVVECTA